MQVGGERDTASGSAQARTTGFRRTFEKSVTAEARSIRRRSRKPSSPPLDPGCVMPGGDDGH